MPILTKAQLEAENQASFPDNNSNYITPEILRNYNTDVIDTLVDSNDTGSFARTDLTNTFTQTNNFTAISASSFVSASIFIGDGSRLTNVTSSIALPILDEGVPVGNAVSMNFSGSAISAYIAAGVAIVSVNALDSASFNAYTASNDAKVNSLIAKTGSYATTGSNNFIGDQHINGDLYISGTNFIDIGEGSFRIVDAGNDITLLDSQQGVQLRNFTANDIIIEQFANSAISIDNNSGSINITSHNPGQGIYLSASVISLNNINFNSYSSSVGTTITDLDTSASLALYTASFDTGSRNLTFTKGNTTQFSVNIPDVSGSTDYTTTASFNEYTQSNDAKVNSLIDATGSYATTGSNTFVGEQIISASLIVTDAMKGTGSITLQPDLNDARTLGIYNTAATDTHITASGGNLFLGNDETYVLVTTYANQKQISIRADEKITASGSIYQSGTFYADQIDVSLGGIQQTTGSYVATFTSGGILTYDTYQNIATELQPYIQTGSVFETGSFATTGSNTFNGNQNISGAINFPNGTYLQGNAGQQTELNSPTRSLKISSGVNTTFAAGDTMRISGSSNIIFSSVRTIISGSLIQSSSNSITGLFGNVGTLIKNRVAIQGGDGVDAPTPRLRLEATDGRTQILGGTFQLIDSTAMTGSAASLGAQYQAYANPISGAASINMGVYTPDTFDTDIELYINTDINGTVFYDFDNVSAFDYIPFLSIAPNLGDNPAPVFTRGLDVTGSLYVSGNIYATNLTGSTIETGSFATTGSNQFNGDQTITGSLNVKTITTFDPAGTTPSDPNASTGTLLVFPYGEYASGNPNMDTIANSAGTGWVMSGPGITDGTVISAGYGNDGVEVNITSGNVVSGSSYIGTGPYYPYLVISGSAFSNQSFYSPQGFFVQNLDGTGLQYGGIAINNNGADPQNIFSTMAVGNGTPEGQLQFGVSSYTPMYPGEPVPTFYAGGYYDAGLGYGSTDTTFTFYSSSIQVWHPIQFKTPNAPIQVTGSINISNQLTTNLFTASLQNGYAWVGNSSGKNYQVATSSFGGGSTPAGTVSSSAQILNYGIFATTGSNAFFGNQSIKGNLTLSGSLTISGSTTFVSKNGGTSNVFLGGGALNNNTTGIGNTAIGQSALGSNTIGSNNFAFGTNALASNIDGNANFVAGADAGRFASGNSNVFIGPSSGQYASGSGNVFIGGSSGQYITGSGNTIIGAYTGTAGTPLNYNIILADGNGNLRARYNSGWEFPGISINGNTTITGSLIQSGAVSIQGDITFINKNGATDNVILGLNAMSNITGSVGSSIAIGDGAMRYASVTQQNVAIGKNALSVTSGSNNFALGSEAMANNTTGNQNVAIGIGALNNNTTGQLNVSIGNDSGFVNVSGSRNTYIGAGAGNNHYGSATVIIGGYSGGGQILNDNIILSDGYGNIKAQYSASGSAWLMKDTVNFTTGSNSQAGTATLDGGNPGTVTVSNSLVTANSIIMLTKQTLAHPNGYVAVSAKSAGSFTITSNHNGDTDVVGWFIINNS